MWRSLVDPKTVNNLRELDVEPAPIIIELISVIAEKPWASGLFVSTSMGSVALTTAPTWNEKRGHGSLRISTSPQRELSLSLHLPNRAEPLGMFCGTVAACVATIQALMNRLNAAADSRPKWDPVDPADDGGTEPRFPSGTLVRVLLNHRNKTERAGVVRMATWHSKHACWVYLLDCDGKPLKKRYFGEDFEAVSVQ